MLAIYLELPQRAARGQQLQPGPHPRRGPARRDLVGHLADRGQVAADHPVDPLQFPYERLAAGVGEVAEGLAIISDAIARAERRGANWQIADLLRVKGELLLLQGPDDPAAEELFHLSLDWARRQNALSWELRTAISLANLRRAQGRVAEGRHILAGVYARLTEGFETADPLIARKLLDELS